MNHLKQNLAVVPPSRDEGGSLGQITECFTGVVGKFRPKV